jgi:hypothetical protein
VYVYHSKLKIKTNKKNKNTKNSHAKKIGINTNIIEEE